MIERGGKKPYIGGVLCTLTDTYTLDNSSFNLKHDEYCLLNSAAALMPTVVGEI